MRFKVRLKIGIYITLFGVVICFVAIHNGTYSGAENQVVSKQTRKVASINPRSLQRNLRHNDDDSNPSSVHHPNDLGGNKPRPATSAIPVLLVPNPCGDPTACSNTSDHNNVTRGLSTLSLRNQSFRKTTKLPGTRETPPISLDVKLGNQIPDLIKNPLMSFSPLNETILRKMGVLSKLGINPKTMVSYLAVFQDVPKVDSKTCPICARAKILRQRSGYASRVLIENDEIPESWEPTPELDERFKERKSHIQKVCHENQLDERSVSNQPNAWEFLLNQKYGLIWCSVFKAASSTWFYNFNILAGYSESFLYTAKETPIAIARKKYPRPSVEELDRAMNSSSRTVAFMIARHPLERLVSAYRDKLQSGNRYYRNLAKKIISSYPSLGPSKAIEFHPKAYSNKSSKKPVIKYISPSFQQFVQFILDSHDKRMDLDEHWAPMTKFCTPCLVDFDVYAKVETLDEDGNYIIYKSGIKDLVHPKRINRAKDKATKDVAESFLCLLTKTQMEGLISLYRMDLELFKYDFTKYLNCTADS